MNTSLNKLRTAVHIHTWVLGNRPARLPIKFEFQSSGPGSWTSAQKPVPLSLNFKSGIMGVGLEFQKAVAGGVQSEVLLSTRRHTLHGHLFCMYAGVGSFPWPVPQGCTMLNCTLVHWRMPHCTRGWRSRVTCSQASELHTRRAAIS